ncbi:BatD family protein [Terriglobus roseus]|uniref:Oxygen tolerance n=1 Tax=Terriglobus roseus TaxID=392734 RepID=A0A1G7L3A8_9BACT|nr:BatD family protein [Terriglobus roseus]SDF43861.1 Oxygen tolerance [Terriglobus roseus]
MKRLLYILFMLSTLHGAAQSPVVRAHFEPSQNIMVGQPVKLIVSVFVPNYFTGSPDFPEFEMENAVVVMPQDRPENSNTQIGDAKYFGITQTYVVYPQQAGDFHLPIIKLSVPYAKTPPQTTKAQVTVPTLSFHADVPSAARGLAYFLPTTQLTITEKWSPSLKKVQAGDTIERTVTITASKMQAMLIPPLQLGAPDGLRIYSSEPIVHDQKTPRGDFIYGQRVETAKYYVEKAGAYTLPSIELQWWNLNTHRLATASLPSISFQAAANPALTAELPPPQPNEQTTQTPKKKTSIHWRRIALVSLQAILCLAVIYFFYQMVRAMRPRADAAWKKRQQSEAAFFRRLVHAAKKGDALLSYTYLLQWFARVYPGQSVSDIVNLRAQPNLQAQISDLTDFLYAQIGSRQWTGRTFVKELEHFRMTNVLRKTRARRHDGSLVELNPYS